MAQVTCIKCGTSFTRSAGPVSGKIDRRCNSCERVRNRLRRPAAGLKTKHVPGYIPVTESGCWLWTGRWDSHGYGVLPSGIRTKHAFAHRVMWEKANGPIPAGLIVCHKCDTPACVNPAHMFIGTPRDNTHDMLRKMRGCHFGRKQTCIPESLLPKAQEVAA